MPEDINIKLGVDGGEYLNSLVQIRDLLVDIGNKSSDLNNEIKTGRKDAVEAEMALAKTIISSSQELNTQKELFADIKKFLSEQSKLSDGAFDASAIALYNKSLSNSKTVLGELQNAGKKGILSPAEVKKLQDAISNTKNEFETLNVVLQVSKEKLKTLDPNTEEFKKLSEEIKTVEALLEVFNDETVELTNNSKSLSSQLKSIIQELAEMKLRGEENTDRYKELQKVGAELTDTLGDTREEIRQLGSDTNSLDHLIRMATLITGSFQVAQGAMALFGIENEDTQKALLKVTAAMSVLNGLQAIQTELTKKDSVARSIATAIQGFWTASIWQTNFALKALRAALIATGIGAFVVLIGFLVESMSSLGDEVDDSTESQEKYNEELEKTLTLLGDIAKKAETERNRREGGLNQLKRELEIAEAANASDEKRADIKRKIIDEEISNLRVLLYTYEGYEEKQAEIQEKISDKLTERIALDIELERNLTEAKKKELEKQLKDNEKYAAEYKKVQEQLRKFLYEEEQTRVDAIADNKEREAAILFKSFEDEVLALEEKQQKLLESDILNADQRKYVQESFEKQRNDIAARYAISFTELEEKQRKERLDNEKKYQKALLDLNGDEQDVAVQGVIDKYDAITKAIKESGTLTSEIEAQIERAKNAELTKISDDYSAEVLNKKEELEIALAKISNDGIGSAEFQEEQKQVAVLKIQLKYAKIRLEALEQAGGEENELAIAQTKNLIDKLNKEIKASTEGKDFTSYMSKLLGITDDEFEEIYGKVSDSVNKVLAIYESALQQKIALQQQEIDAYNDKIDEAESALQREIKLQKQGYAANVDAKREELDLLKRERDKDLQEQKENQRKLAQVQIAKQAGSLAVAAANLIETTSEIINSATQSFGWVGGLIGLAEAAVVVGEFFALRNSIKNYQSLGEGGEVGGYSHAEGGNKYVSIDGNDPSIVEIEKGEFVVNKRSAKKHKRLIQAANNDELSSMTYRDIMQLIGASDITYNSETVDSAGIGTNIIVSNSIDNSSLEDIAVNTKAIADTTKELLQRDKDKLVVEETPEVRIETRGNHKKIIKKI